MCYGARLLMVCFAELSFGSYGCGSLTPGLELSVSMHGYITRWSNSVHVSVSLFGLVRTLECRSTGISFACLIGGCSGLLALPTYLFHYSHAVPSGAKNLRGSSLDVQGAGASVWVPFEFVVVWRRLQYTGLLVA